MIISNEYDHAVFELAFILFYYGPIMDGIDRRSRIPVSEDMQVEAYHLSATMEDNFIFAFQVMSSLFEFERKWGLL